MRTFRRAQEQAKSYMSTTSRKRTPMRKSRLQFGLWWLFVLPVLVGLLTALYLHNRSHRECPRIWYSRWSYDSSPRQPQYILQVIGKDWAESYCDWPPFGTLNHAGVTVNGRSVRCEFFWEERLGTPDEDKVGHISPECIARYETLKAFLVARVNIQEVHHGRRIEVLLPRDYPTFEEFVAGWRNQHRQAKDEPERIGSR